MIGFVHVGIYGVMPFTRIGVLKTVPSSIALIVPLGDFHISLRLYSGILAALGVIVAHFTATPYFLVALAESIVT